MAIDVRDLRMRYGTKDVLTGVSFAARRGEVLALLGPNGAGKSTTIEILEGFRTRSAGQVTVLGQDPAHGDEAWRARLGVVLQSWRDHGRWKVRELLDYLARFYVPFSDPRIERPWNVDELLDAVGLTEHADQKVKALSGGQRRRLDVAIGIVGKPELVFLDEPTAGFDPHARREFHDLVHRLSDFENTTILITTHDLDEAEKLADRILILDEGTIVANGSADELARQMAQGAEVRWTADGRRHVHAAEQSDPTGFVRDLLTKDPGVTELEVRRASLEDTYMALVHRAETGQSGPGNDQAGTDGTRAEEPHAGQPRADGSVSGAQAPDGSVDDGTSKNDQTQEVRS
ncbi:ABC transporter ATP-binding protein [Myceligenerans salitolerans]|uniref:ABC transporter ATP-binding protein n=2 Tax=Myceligenerans salitolerans TaxID=1230528 RepID=A0ABS3I9F1_9MICO|nr:ABC transporter ATP-binding protein [Myceligenerans salitolerans]